MRKTRTIAMCGLLFALAIALGWCEGWLAGLMALPAGVKPGLANVVVMFALYMLSPGYALLLVLLKAGFGLLTRGALAGLLSLSGGLFSWVVMTLLLRLRRVPGMAVVSVAGALAHNLAQLMVILCFWGKVVLLYLPVLLISGVVMGVLTGALLHVLLPLLHRQFGFLYEASTPTHKDRKEGTD